MPFFPALPLCLVSFIQSYNFPPFFLQVQLWRKAALLPALPISASGNTQYEVTQASLLWAMAAALDLHRETALPVPLHKGLVHSVLPSASASAYAVFTKLSAGDFCKKISRHLINFFIKVSTVGFYICP